LYWSTADLLCYLQIGLTLFMGAAMLQAGELSVGTLFAFLTYLGLVVWPVRQLGRVLTETGKAAVATRRLQEILREPVEADRQTEIAAQPLTGAVNFKSVCFSYGDTPALKQVSFNIEPGQTVALVGPPGSGKSTIVQLLLRLYDYQQGSITLDGQELADMPRAFVRSQMGTVLQEPYLYSKSIAGNLRIGRHDADQPALEQVTTAACIHDAIASFKAGYNTLVGERGVTLSGGQRQRMAIARALLKDAPILILDDALSAIDSRTEARIVHTLAARRGRHTTLVIAHRLSSIVHADRILVLQEGSVVQSGSHPELLQQAGPYRRLWQLQGTVDATIEKDIQKVVKAG
jgi:ATP-binding cassette subfamily B protein